LPLRIAFKELRGGLRDFRLFLACLIIGTAVIAAVGSLSQNIRQTIFDEAKTLLGGDVSLTTTNQPPTPDQIAFFKQWGSVSEVVEMRAMAGYGQSVALVELKGVDSPYPLLGKLTRTDGSAAAVESGTILVATNLLDELAAKIGDTITIGTAAFKMNRITLAVDSALVRASLSERTILPKPVCWAPKNWYSIALVSC
jgi:putative ABC transport system permease protein